ncbi:MAG: sigma-70 family RNA polymerase sigma factor [Cellvibrionales bacterium]|nr:sigma-70 family RNA polymerase sigma factor [Cellvibrionales bacterium]
MPDTRHRKKNDAEVQEEQAWLAAIANSQDEIAFSCLFDRYAPKIKAFCLAKSPGSITMADELVQEVMVKIWQKAHLYHPELASPSTWIFTLARNTRVDFFRKQHRHQTDITAEDIYDDLIDETQDLFIAAHQKQQQKHIQQAMSHLSLDQTEVIAKVYMEGKSHSQVADELQLPLGTVKSRIRLALSKLGLSLGELL